MSGTRPVVCGLRLGVTGGGTPGEAIGPTPGLTVVVTFCLMVGLTGGSGWSPFVSPGLIDGGCESV